jgi:hypothetical protein
MLRRNFLKLLGALPFAGLVKREKSAKSILADVEYVDEISDTTFCVTGDFISDGMLTNIPIGFTPDYFRLACVCPGEVDLVDWHISDPPALDGIVPFIFNLDASNFSGSRVHGMSIAGNLLKEGKKYIYYAVKYRI